MIDWLANTFDMRFYYWTGLNWLMLIPVYVVGGALITLLWWWLAKRIKRSLAVIVPLYLLLAIGPWVEELWIAWNFGHLCRKDAGIFVYKTVETDGYYDATAGLLQIQQPLPEVTSKNFDKRGYKFYEMSLADTKGGPTKVAHFEKIHGQWIGKVLDQPAARYYYTSEIYGKTVAHKIIRTESRVTDQALAEVIGRYVEYGRGAPWFFVGLSEPPYSCDGPEGGPHSRHNRLLYRDVLIPVR